MGLQRFFLLNTSTGLPAGSHIMLAWDSAQYTHNHRKTINLYTTSQMWGSWKCSRRRWSHQPAPPGAHHHGWCRRGKTPPTWCPIMTVSQPHNGAVSPASAIYEETGTSAPQTGTTTGRLSSPSPRTSHISSAGLWVTLCGPWGWSGVATATSGGYSSAAAAA